MSIDTNIVIRERIQALRKEMKKDGIDVYYVPTGDFHGSEYVSEYFQCRKFLSGFDGSAGSLVVTPGEVGLFTDGRYFIQAEEQLKGTGIILYKTGVEGVPTLQQYIMKSLPESGTLGFDGRMVSAAWLFQMQRMLTKKKGRILTKYDLVDRIWDNRPPVLFRPAWLLPEEYTGSSRKEKLARLRKWLAEKSGKGNASSEQKVSDEKKECLVLSTLDEIAWLLNIRGEDIPCNPVVFSYLVLDEEHCFLFVQNGVFSENDICRLEDDGITLCTYDEILSFMCSYPQKVNIFVDKRHTNAEIVGNFPKVSKIVDILSPIENWKAVKNETEIRREKEIHIRDGAAVTKFIFWLKKQIGRERITEISAAERLEAFRKEQADYRGPSFDTISAYAEHGAIVHYSPSEETDAELFPENFLLVDSGGQYLGGTTDITRTIFLGQEISEEQKRNYTAVLRGNLNLMAAKFKYGCSGVALDYAARKPLWDIGLDFNHGTGHGVGAFLNVHEGPNAINYKIAKGPGKNVMFEAGMITSDEPGIYLEGKYGIRLENLILCVEKEENEFGRFMGFEPLTFVPFDRMAIDPAQMNREEIEILNTYHAQVYEKLSPYLTEKERDFLKKECAPL